MDDDWDDSAWEAIAMEADLIERSVSRGDQSGPNQFTNNEWACPRCTLKNPQSNSTCNACNYSAIQTNSNVSSTIVSSQLRDTSMSSWLIASNQPIAPNPPKLSATTSTGPIQTHLPAKPSTTVSSSSHGKTQHRQSLALPTGRNSLSFLPNPLEIPEESVVMGAEIDRDLATTWIYPSNYPIRSYQQSIARAALLQNTLVCLPTGLGKTLIAAVVMYNFYRWFPRGKIVFMAPTKPLVSQQIQACHDVMPIPQTDMAELQGNVAPAKRKLLWSTRRVFFCTPQSLQNDIERGNCDVRSFVCVVIDEAHRATGNYAYVVVIKAIAAKVSGFRVLALSATPGSKFDVIQDVLTNLRISHIECKNGDDPDVRKYTHSRQEEIIKCKMNMEVTGVKDQYLKLFNPILHRLCSSQVFHQRDPTKLTRWMVINSRDRMRENPQGSKPYRTVEADFALLASMIHGRDILSQHGIGNFQSYIEKFQTESIMGPKKSILESPDFVKLMELVNAQCAGGRTATNNPKLIQLQKVLHEHFTRHAQGGSSTRSIVFTQYRESVAEIVQLLSKMEPLIKVKPFIGQGSSKGKGQTQKQQQEVVAKFRAGEFNVLAATCIAEEGLDIGEVDLIVSFDCLTSPVRMIQRMGRTGRKRVGRVVLLVTEGEEEKKLERSVAAAKSVNRSLTVFKDKFKFVPCARMVPRGIVPQVAENAMIVPTFHASLIGGKKGAKKGLSATSNDWQLNEDENQMLQMKHRGSFSRRINLFSIMPPIRLSDFSKPHHFGRTRRSRCLLQLVHRIQDSRMSNAEFYQRYRRALPDAVASKEILLTPDTVPPQIERLPNESPHIGSNDGDVALSYNESIDLDDFPMSFEERGDSIQFPLPAEPHENAPHTSQSTLKPEVIELHSSPEMDNIESPNRSQDSKLPRIFQTGINQPPAKSLMQSIDEKKQATPTKNKSSIRPPPKRTNSVKSPPQPRKIKNRINSAIKSPLAKVKEGSARIPSGDFSLDITLSPLQQGEQVIAMLEYLSTRQMSSPEKSQQKSPPILSPHLTPSQPKSKPFPRLITPVHSSDPRPEITEVIVPKPPNDDEDSLEQIELTKRVAQNPSVAIESYTLTPVTPVSRSSHCTPRNSNTISEEKSIEFIPETPTPHEPCTAPNNVQKKLGFNPLSDLSPILPPPSIKSRKRLITTPSSEGIKSPQEPLKSTSAHQVTTNTSSPCIKQTESDLDLSDDFEVDFAILGKTTRELQPKYMHDEFVEATPSASVTQTPKKASPYIRPSQTNCRLPSTQLNENCQVCGDDESSDVDPILYCDGCNVAVHQHCYGVHEIPATDWFCDACQDSTKPDRCVLCPALKGALKQTLCRQWVHVQCYLWIPELHIRVVGNSIQLGSLETLDAERFSLKCEICRSTQGFGIVQCAYRACLRAFHVSCAFSAKYQLVQNEDVEDAQFLVFCPMHQVAEKMDREAYLLPSHVLATTPASAEAKKKRKRLKKATSPTKGKRKKASKQLMSHYIEMEADVDGDGSNDEDEENEHGDPTMSSFIDDASQSQFLSPASMQAIYRRRTSHSPIVSRYLPLNGVVAACLQDADRSLDISDGDILHHGYSCRECGLNPIEGVRYSCQRCPSFDLCICCYSSRDEFHPRDHRFRAVDEPVEPKALVSTERQEMTPTLIQRSTTTTASKKHQVNSAQSEVKQPPPGQLTAEQIARMQESRRKALELKERRLKVAQHPIIDVTSTELDKIPSPVRPPQESMKPPAPPTSIPFPSIDSAVDDMPSFSLLPTLNIPPPAPILSFTIAYHPQSPWLSLLNDLLTYQPLPKVAEITLECDLLLSSRNAVVITSLPEFKSFMTLAKCPQLHVLAAFGTMTYLVHAPAMMSSEVMALSSAYCSRHPGIEIHLVSSSADVLRHVLDVAKREAGGGYSLAQYDNGKGKDRLFLDRWNLFQVPSLSYGGQQALTNRFNNLSVLQIIQMNLKFNPMHWKRMLPWISDHVAQSIHQHVKGYRLN